MNKLKMTITLLCILLIGQHAHAVVNKGTSQVSSNKEENEPNEVKADDRISNSYGPPPSGFGVNGPAPVYGPPELVGNHGPPTIYPPPPPELPPPVAGPPSSSYGPPRNHHIPLKQSYGPPLSSFPPKLSFGVSKIPFASPPKQHLGSLHSFPSLRPPKFPFGPPLTSQYGPPRPGHGPVIPISLETYGPPPPQLNIQFKPGQNDGHAPAPVPLPVPQLQYQHTPGDIHGPPPPGPPPGVAAPPTPPDIKYDGWQPIAGITSQHGTSSDSSRNSGHANSNVPSDSYGVPIHNPEAQDLKMSVESSSDANGLPPPPLPQYEPLHNDVQNPPKIHGPPVFNPSKPSSGIHFEVPKVEPLSIVKTVGFELLPSSGSLGSQSLSLSHDSISSTNQLSTSLNLHSGPSIPTLQLETHDSGSNGYSIESERGKGHLNVGNELSLQQVSIQAPSDSYGPPQSSISFGKINGIGSDISLPPPPPIFDSYAVPPLSSYSPNGPYPAAHSGRASPTSFGFHKHHHRLHGSFRIPSIPGTLVPPRNREAIKFRESVPPALLSNLHRHLPSFGKPPKPFITPPSFGQQLPNLNFPAAFHQSSGPSNSFTGYFSSGGSFSKSNNFNLNSPMAAPNVQYGTPLSFVDFNTPAPILTYGAPNFGPSTSFGSTSTGFGNNLYSSIGNTITTTYGTPVVNAPLSTGIGHDCGFQQSGGEIQLNLENNENHAQNLENNGRSFTSFTPGNQPASPPATLSLSLPESLPPSLPASLPESIPESLPASLPASQPVSHPAPLDVNQHELFKTAIEAATKTLGGTQITPSVNQLDLENYEQQKTDLRDSYGNPIGVTYDIPEHSDNTLSTGHNNSPAHDVINIGHLSPPSHQENLFPPNNQFSHGTGISAEALTASLTMQGFTQSKNIGTNEVDANQFLKTHEGSEALSLAQGLTAQGANGFEIQGSKGTYMLQIQAADGGLGTENSDGNIRHDQVLSNGLLQDILAAIEQPDQGRIQLQGLPQAQQLQKIYSDPPRTVNIPERGGHFITINNPTQNKDIEGFNVHADDRSETRPVKEDEIVPPKAAIALFFNNQHSESRKETRSVSKNESQGTASVEDQTKQGNAKNL